MLRMIENINHIVHYSSAPIHWRSVFRAARFKASAVLKFVSVLSVVMISLAAAPSHAETVSQLDSMRAIMAQLSAVQRNSIEQQCSAVQNESDNSVFRQCVQNQLNPAPTGDMSAFDALTFDDKYAVQQACATTRRSPILTYQDCLQLEVAELSLIPVPVLENLPEDERYVLRQSCFDTQTKSGGAAYRLCMNSEIEQLSQVPEVDLSYLSSLDRNAIQMVCSPNATTQSVSAYRQCLARELTESGLARKPAPPIPTEKARTGTVAIATNTVAQPANTESVGAALPVQPTATAAAAQPKQETVAAPPLATRDSPVVVSPVIKRQPQQPVAVEQPLSAGNTDAS
ncbi:MAG: hypothetical protein KTR32_19680, partial [Granulosicoccus sp.]|nr:hypothetical protein [Granulosicoccus sp.]